MIKLVTLNFLLRRNILLEVRKVFQYLLPSSKKPYIVCGTIICLVTVPSVEESGELGVTAVEVT